MRSGMVGVRSARRFSAVLCVRVAAACVAGGWLSAAAPGQAVRFPADARVIDAATFGAAPNDGIDDTAAINAALNAPRPSGSNAKTVYLADGVYNISNTILWPDSRIVLQGQSQAGTVLRLNDNLPAFANPATPKNVVSTREAGGFSANEFRSSIFDLTVDTGVGNPGAIGVRLHQNNQGGMRNVTIRSSDPARVGLRGLDLAGSDRGPGMIRNVTIEGFDEGVFVAGTEYSMVFDGLTLRHQRIVGIFNLWNILSIRNLVSENSVPVIRNVVDGANFFEWGMILLIDATLTGGSPAQPAIFNQARLYLRNITASGYSSVLSENGALLPSLTIAEYANPRFYSVFQSPRASLNLAIEDTPEVPWDDPANLPGNPLGWWANVEAFGANGFDTADDSAAIQAAIDSGATTVYLPAGRYFIGQTVRVRGAVRRLTGVESSVEAAAPLSGTTAALFAVDDAAAAPVVTFERFSMNAGATATGVEHNSTRTLVLRNAGMDNYRGSGGGKLFQEDVVGGPWLFSAGQRAWLRQVNPENPGVKITNDGGTVWILGLKTEKPGTPIVTRGAGRTELLGGLIYPVNTLPIEEPMFINDESSFSAVIGESAYGGEAFHRVIVEETRGGELRRLWFGEIPRRVGFGFGAALTAYAGYIDPSPPPVVGPVAHWPLDASSGTVAADVSGNGFDGVVSGADWTAGIAGNALNFDGADFADLPENMVTTSAGAIALWVRTSHDYTDTGHIFYGTDTTDGFANGGGAQNELHLNFRADDGVSFFIEGGGADVNLGTSGPINNGQWRFLVASWDRTGFNDLYLDGQRVAANSADGNLFGLSARTWWGRPNAAGRRLFGLLDDVRLYNRPLEHWEVLERYNATIGFANYPPAVSAGTDLTVQNAAYTRVLEGQAVDDGQPLGTFTVQ